MYTLIVFNHETQIEERALIFETKRDCNKFLKDNAEKRGYDFFVKGNRSLEYVKNY